MSGKLKPLEVARNVTPGKYADGSGLYLIVAGPTSRNWSYRYWFGGKEHWHGLGSLSDVSLREAREKRDAARQQVRAGIDVVEAKRLARHEANVTAAMLAAPTFRECADRYIAENEAGWSAKHAAQWPTSLARYAFPTIGDLRIAEIRPSHVYDLLEPIWTTKRETANRVRGRIETIIAANVDINDRDFRNPAELTKQLREKLPKRAKRVVRHHPALPYADLPSFMVALSSAAGQAAHALAFLILTAARTNEVIGARWEEIDRASPTGPVWKIPGERMKAGEDHVVPLSAAAVAILDSIGQDSKSEMIFTNPAGRSFSENALLAALARLGYGHVTAHGFRATFGTWAEECTEYPDGVREAALAHRYKNETVAAYQRGGKLEKRRALMDDWAKYATPNSHTERVQYRA